MNRSILSSPSRLIAAAILAAGSMGLAAQTLVYEREFSMIAEADNTLRITLTEDDRLVIERPFFMTRPGRFEGAAPAGTYERLAAELTGVAPISRTTDQDVRQRAANELVHVTDPEYTRFVLFDDRRQVIEAVEATSVEAWSRQFDDDIRLTRLAELERDWMALMDQALAGAAE